ncbi:MAG: hypothetical protein M0Q92_01150 [Methanoregula sp.]|jgi:hypothetical protein|nr:hypothetical protein [Methanoregula sp.]
MPDFRPRPGTTTTAYRLKKPIADINAFNVIIRSLVYDNPLGCTRYAIRMKGHPPVRKVREMYTAKFEYRNGDGKRIGTTIEMYDSVDGYETGIAAVISNMANIASHRGKPKHLPEKDLFSVMLQCHDHSGEQYYLNIARNRPSLSSYRDGKIRERVETWASGEPALA